MSTPTAHEYFADVFSIAQDIVAEHGDNEDCIQDAIHEACDGSQWVIYTYRARKVLEFSSNDEAGPDSMGWDGFASGCNGWCDLFTRGAYFAMCADVSEKVQELLFSDAEEAHHDV
jgi:hypothetical protein